MIIGHDRFKKRINISDAKKGIVYYCPYCGRELIQKKGNYKSHHFAHKGDSNSHNKNKCEETWNHCMTKWHVSWQQMFDDDYLEKILIHNNIKHIADVLINGTAIEFQHSKISIDEFNERNSFYLQQNLKVIWVFDLIDEYENQKIINNPYNNNDNMFSWSYPKKIFREMDSDDDRIQIYFQLGEDYCCLERVHKYHDNFKTFYTDINHTFTKEEFIDYANNDISKLFYIPKKEKVIDKKPLDYSLIVGGKTILELWTETTKWMIVRNLKNNKIYNLYYDPRADIKKRNMVFGKQSSCKISNFNYKFYDNQVPLYNWNEPIWRIEKSTKRMELKKPTNYNHAHTLTSLFELNKHSNGFIVFSIECQKYFYIQILDNNAAKPLFNMYLCNGITGEIYGLNNDYAHKVHEKIWIKYDDTKFS